MSAESDRDRAEPELELFELDADDDVWSVFDRDSFHPNPGFTARWWHKTRWRTLPERYFVVESAGVEVARVMVNPESLVPRGYAGEHSGARAVEVQLLEVHKQYRSRGIGKRVVTGVTALFGGVVFAKAEDGPGEFWSRLGWLEYRYATPRRNVWRLFVRPEVSEPFAQRAASR